MEHYSLLVVENQLQHSVKGQIQLRMEVMIGTWQKGKKKSNEDFINSHTNRKKINFRSMRKKLK